jgi:YMGG-like Gly-zipper
MTRFLLIVPMMGLVAACDPLQQSQLGGTVGGAAIGALITPENPEKGAVIGGAIGLAAGSMIGYTASGQCVYQRSDGSRYVGVC